MHVQLSTGHVCLFICVLYDFLCVCMDLMMYILMYDV